MAIPARLPLLQYTIIVRVPQSQSHPSNSSGIFVADCKLGNEVADGIFELLMHGKGGYRRNTKKLDGEIYVNLCISFFLSFFLSFRIVRHDGTNTMTKNTRTWPCFQSSSPRTSMIASKRFVWIPFHNSWGGTLGAAADTTAVVASTSTASSIIGETVLAAATAEIDGDIADTSQEVTEDKEDGIRVK